MFRNLLFLASSILVVFAPTTAAAQNTLKARVIDAHERSPLPGVNVLVEGTTVGDVTDANGVVSISPIPDGLHTITFSFIGFRTRRVALSFPQADSITIALEEDESELDDITITATRTSRTIADTPTRVETIGGEEIEEKIAMDPSGISMILNESPGIVVQQTSAVSASASFRIQGLDGRYTQLLRDGFPLYGGLGGGLSLLQIPPLDLAQVEVIKGPSSTLYGGDAIAGLVNLVSKRPTEEGERSFLINATTAGGLDAATYLAKRTDRIGYTVLASGNVQRAFDPEPDNFTNLPATRRLTLSPTIFHYGSGTTTLRLSGTAEEREAGDIDVLDGRTTGFTEVNRSERLSAAAGHERPLGVGVRLTIRSSGSVFRRSVETPGFRFAGRQSTSYTELSATRREARHETVLGVDLRTDRFDQTAGSVPTLDYSSNSVGAFVQDTWDVTVRTAIESGLRVDAHGTSGTFVLPRVAALFRLGGGFTARIGGGLGYKSPTPFLEEAEARSYRGVLPVDDNVDTERSAGGNVDLNYRITMGPVALSMNQAVYVTRLSNPLVAVETAESMSVINFAGSVLARGSETTARISVDDFALFLGYVFLRAERQEDGESVELPHTARHRTYTVLVWEQHGRGRVGLEAYYTGPQALVDDERSPGYLIAGVMAQWRFGAVRVFANLENVLDARQSRTSPIVLGTREDPEFAPVWGPTDGFVANAGIIVGF